MIPRERVLQLMQESLNGLQRAELIERQVTVSDDTVLLGAGSPLDSIAFVAFITDMEDRLRRETGQDIYLVLNEIHEFNADNPFLSADTLAQYTVRLTREQNPIHG